jgi:hypothetical protein
VRQVGYLPELYEDARSEKYLTKGHYYLRHVCLSVRPSTHPPVRPPSRNSSADTGRIFMELDISEYFSKNVSQFNFL